MQLGAIGAVCLSMGLSMGLSGGLASAEPQIMPDGHVLTPQAAPGAVLQTLNPGLPDHPDYLAGQAVKTVISPDGATLLVLTSGFNSLVDAAGAFEPAASGEYLFVYDIGGEHAGRPALRQVIPIPNTYMGVAFSPDGRWIYVSGGIDDVVYRYGRGETGWVKSAAIALGHHGGVGFGQRAVAGNLAVSADGAMLVICNSFNDSVSLVDTRSERVIDEYDLRPYHTTPGRGQGLAGGETPFAVALLGTRAYIGSLRDREIVVLELRDPRRPRLLARIAVPGNPNAIAVSPPGRPARLYVTQDNADRVAVIDPARNIVLDEIDVTGQGAGGPHYTGAAPNSLALAPDGRRIYVTNGGQNAIAVAAIGTGRRPALGLIPTGWSPQSVSLSHDGRFVYVVNSKSKPGPDPAHLTNFTAILHSPHDAAAAAAARASNQYILQREHAGLLTLPVPDAAGLQRLTRIVAANTTAAADAQAEQVMAGLRRRIAHVIYIVKENRTFDQVLGDLGNGANGAPGLAVFGRRVTPNLHRAAEDFVTLDNFYDPGEVSGNGWQWSTAARETDFNAKNIPLNYATSPTGTQRGRGPPFEAEGENRDADTGIATLAARIAARPDYARLTAGFAGGTANFLPGTNDDDAPDGPAGARQTGYVWDSAVRAGLSVRNYGFFIDLGAHYANVADPFARKSVQANATNPTLAGRTDPYFRSFDNAYPDYWRYLEWRREFDGFVASGTLPRLTLLRYMHDHMGNFGTTAAAARAVGGLDFPEAQQADNDYAVGLTLDALAHSRYAADTLVFVVEDDAQDGPDHVDAHRSTAYVVGPYVKHHAVDSTRYTTVNVVRTIEDVLGIGHLNLNDSQALPMASVFDLGQSGWSFAAVASPFLKGTVAATPQTRFADAAPALRAHDPAWWARQTAGFDWSREDRVPAAAFNRVLAMGLGPAAARSTPGAAPGAADQQGGEPRGEADRGDQGRQRQPGEPPNQTDPGQHGSGKPAVIDKQAP